MVEAEIPVEACNQFTVRHSTEEDKIQFSQTGILKM